MEEINIILNEINFTQICKTGFLTFNSPSGRIETYIGKSEMIELMSGSLLKETNGYNLKLNIVNIDSLMIKEIVKRSPLYSDLVVKL
jgi:hypothetical protein